MSWMADALGRRELAGLVRPSEAAEESRREKWPVTGRTERPKQRANANHAEIVRESETTATADETRLA